MMDAQGLLGMTMAAISEADRGRTAGVLVIVKDWPRNLTHCRALGLCLDASTSVKLTQIW